MIDRPGIYTISAAEYHADPCPEPSLSASLARELVAASPRHAWWSSPRLNAAYQRDDDEKFDRGTAAHAYLLEGEDGFVLIDAPDFRTKSAREARDQARAAGKVPLLRHRWDEVLAMVEAANRQLDAHQDLPRPFAFGKPEQTLIWQDDGIWCRARLDWLHDHGGHVDDYKTTEMPANPDRWTRGPLFAMGYDIQASFYLRGLEALGVEGSFRFVVQENYAPFQLAVIGVGPSVLGLAERKVAYAIRAWRECLASGVWPGYPTRTCWAELPPWEETRWMEREVREATVPQTAPLDDGRPLADQLMGDAR